MNYRHAFHAGNFADVFKHALLVRILSYLLQKATPIVVLDTHAGIGRYDLKSEAAQRSPEWQNGIARLVEADLGAAEALLRPYLALALREQSEFHLTAYPGSPLIAQAMLRREDRLVLCELHPQDVETLRQAIGRDKRVDVRAMDGYAGLKAVVPPLERRGLVLIDPPFEQPSEWRDMAEAVKGALRKWPTGVYALWYPIKEGDEGAALAKALEGAAISSLLQLELMVQGAGAAGRHSRKGLAGNGLLVINPPYLLADEARVMLPELARLLAIGDAEWQVNWLVQR